MTVAGMFDLDVELKCFSSLYSRQNITLDILHILSYFHIAHIVLHFELSFLYIFNIASLIIVPVFLVPDYIFLPELYCSPLTTKTNYLYVWR